MFSRKEEETPFISPDHAKQKSYTGLLPYRYIFAVLACFGFINVYAMRVNLSVAMVAMVNSSALKPSGNISEECAEENKYNNNSSTVPSKDGEFVWDEKTQGIILGSFFWGYILTQLPGGRLAEIFSGKWLFGGGVLCTALFTLLTPVAARAGTTWLIIVRIAEGLGEGVTFPAMHAMIAKWSPPFERSRIVTIIYAGTLLGTVIALPISGILCQHGFAGGWPSVFYVFGLLGIAWFILWAFLGFDGPEDHPWISTKEKQFILTSIGYTNKVERTPPVPWKKVITSLPVWAIIVGHFGNNWGFYTLLTELPTYLKTILHFNMEKNSYMSALPYLGCWATGIVSSSICDYLRENHVITTGTARKIFNTIGFLIPAICLIIVTLTGCDQQLAFTFLVIAMSLNGAYYAGFQGNHVDIAPTFAGTLLGITNTVATIPGIFGPYVVGVLTQGQETRARWAIVFYITSVIYVVTAVFYAVFCKGEEQPWNNVITKEILEESEEEGAFFQRSRSSDRDLNPNPTYE